MDKIHRIMVLQIYQAHKLREDREVHKPRD